MNLIEQANVLKGLDDMTLQAEMQSPSGAAPPFLVLTEIGRRKDMRQRFAAEAARQKPSTTVVEDIAFGAMPSMPSGGIGDAVAAPQGFASGGLVDAVPSYSSLRERVNTSLTNLTGDRDRARALALLAASAGILGGGSSNTLKNLGAGINAGVNAYAGQLEHVDSREAALLRNLQDIDLAELDQQYRERTNADESFYAPAVGTIDGKPAYVQFGNRGSVRPADVPAGFTPQSRFEKIDAGDSWIIKDTTTGVTEVIPKQGAPGTNMNVEGLGTDRTMTPAPGSSEALERAAAEEKAALANAASIQTADVVTTDIDRAISSIKANPGMTTSWGALFTQDLGAGPAADVKKLIDTVRANVSFDKLQQMRAASPTGAALGPVSDFENKLLQATIGNLELSQNETQLLENLQRVKDIYTKIITVGIEDPSNPAGNLPQPETQADFDALPAGALYVDPDDGKTYRKE
jgi:hypothetical protein